MTSGALPLGNFLPADFIPSICTFGVLRTPRDTASGVPSCIGRTRGDKREGRKGPLSGVCVGSEERPQGREGRKGPLSGVCVGSERKATGAAVSGGDRGTLAIGAGGSVRPPAPTTSRSRSFQPCPQRERPRNRMGPLEPQGERREGEKEPGSVPCGRAQGRHLRRSNTVRSTEHSVQRLNLYSEACGCKCVRQHSKAATCSVCSPEHAAGTIDLVRARRRKTRAEGKVGPEFSCCKSYAERWRFVDLHFRGSTWCAGSATSTEIPYAMYLSPRRGGGGRSIGSRDGPQRRTTTPGCQGCDLTLSPGTELIMPSWCAATQA